MTSPVDPAMRIGALALLRTDDIAEIIGTNPAKVRRMAKKGKLPDPLHTQPFGLWEAKTVWEWVRATKTLNTIGFIPVQHWPADSQDPVIKNTRVGLTLTYTHPRGTLVIYYPRGRAILPKRALVSDDPNATIVLIQGAIIGAHFTASVYPPHHNHSYTLTTGDIAPIVGGTLPFFPPELHYAANMPAGTYPARTDDHHAQICALENITTPAGEPLLNHNAGNGLRDYIRETLIRDYEAAQEAIEYATYMPYLTVPAHPKTVTGPPADCDTASETYAALTAPITPTPLPAPTPLSSALYTYTSGIVGLTLNPQNPHENSIINRLQPATTFTLAHALLAADCPTTATAQHDPLTPLLASTDQTQHQPRPTVLPAPMPELIAYLAATTTNPDNLLIDLTNPYMPLIRDEHHNWHPLPLSSESGYQAGYHGNGPRALAATIHELSHRLMRKLTTTVTGCDTSHTEPLNGFVTYHHPYPGSPLEWDNYPREFTIRQAALMFPDKENPAINEVAR